MPPAAQEGGHVGEEGVGLGLEVELGFHQDHLEKSQQRGIPL